MVINVPFVIEQINGRRFCTSCHFLNLIYSNLKVLQQFSVVWLLSLRHNVYCSGRLQRSLTVTSARFAAKTRPSPVPKPKHLSRKILSLSSTLDIGLSLDIAENIAEKHAEITVRLRPAGLNNGFHRFCCMRENCSVHQ